MERIKVERPIIEQSGDLEIVEGFEIGEVLSQLYPHNVGNTEHKGNMKVIETKTYGMIGTAQCVMPDCPIAVEVEVL